MYIDIDNVKSELKDVLDILNQYKLLADINVNSVFSSETLFTSVKFPPSLFDFYMMINKKEFTFLLIDGSILQIGLIYNPETCQVEKYRYCYYNPSIYNRIKKDKEKYIWAGHWPLLNIIFDFLLDKAAALGDIIGYDIDDTLMEAMTKFEDGSELSYLLSQLANSYTLPNSIRFDYNRSGPNELWHPASHATFLSNNVRLAVDHLLRPSWFTAISISHFSSLKTTTDMEPIFHKLLSISAHYQQEADTILLSSLKEIARIQKVYITSS